MSEEYTIILFYKFITIDDPEALQQEQLELCKKLGLTGRLLIAKEGINGTFEGTPEAIESYKKSMHADSRFSDMLFKESAGIGYAFGKLKIKVRDEIVSLQAGEFDVAQETAPTVSIDELQEWYEKDEDFVVLDLRNDYEIMSGAFERTIDPGLRNFRDLNDKLEELKELKDKKIVTVCTGGIRCEKATCLLKRHGFDNMYQLKDGIHTYMEKYPGQHFKGTLYVFDNRMVTDVVNITNKEILGRCKYCATPCETYYSDDSVKPSVRVICCDECYPQHSEELRPAVELKQAA